METSRSQDKMRTSQTVQQQQQQRPQQAWPELSRTLDDIETTFGFIPDFVSFVSRQAIPGAWAAIKNVYFNPNTALDPKLKDLIGLAVASQIPCEKCTYFAQAGAEMNRATTSEQSEAV